MKLLYVFILFWTKSIHYYDVQTHKWKLPKCSIIFLIWTSITANDGLQFIWVTCSVTHLYYIPFTDTLHSHSLTHSAGDAAQSCSITFLMPQWWCLFLGPFGICKQELSHTPPKAHSAELLNSFRSTAAKWAASDDQETPAMLRGSQFCSKWTEK